MKLKLLRPLLATLVTERVPRLQAKQENPIATPRLRGRRGVEERARYLRLHPLCVACQRKGITRLADQVDHVIPLSEGGPDTDENKQGLCYFHHRAKVAAENKARASKPRH